MDGEFNHIVVPNDPSSKTIIYSLKDDGNQPESVGDVREINSFSRSNAMFVVTTKMKYGITGKMKNGAEIDLQKIRFWQLQAEGNNKYKRRTAYIKIDEENIPFIVLPAKVEVNSEMESISVDRNKKLHLNCLKYYSKNGDFSNETLFTKQCGQLIARTEKESVDGSIKVSILFFETGASIEKIEGLTSYLSENKRYDISLYLDQSRNNIVSFCKAVICNEDTSSDMYANTVVVGGSLLGKNSDDYNYFTQKYLYKNFLGYFREVDPHGKVNNPERTKMIALAFDLEQKDYFTAFNKLSRYLTNKLKKEDIYPPAESNKYVRITPLLIEEIVDFDR